jgi:hypothetical protein
VNAIPIVQKTVFAIPAKIKTNIKTVESGAIQARKALSAAAAAPISSTFRLPH